MALVESERRFEELPDGAQVVCGEAGEQAAGLIAQGPPLGTGFSALSNALALVTRTEESLIGAVTFLQLPLVFLSTAFMQASLMPGWMSTVADYNPVDWAITAGREAVQPGTDWGTVFGYCGLLAAFVFACLVIATRAFRAYQAQV